jgi:hypothetical protein
MRSTILAAATLAACGDDGATAPDAQVDAPTMCPPQTASPLPMGAHAVYLNFDGVTLTKCTPADSRANCTDQIKQDPSVIPPYMDGDPNRQVRIDFIVTTVQRALAPYSVDIVTTRPTSGDYFMVVLGGSATQLGFPGISGVAQLPCDATNRNLVSLEFDNVLLGIPQSGLVLSDIGLMIGMGLPTDANDCANRTEDWTSVCTYGAMATAAAQNNCGRTPTQDEPALLAAAFGCR